MERNVVYLDHSATTPLHPKVREAMLPYLIGKYGNASSLHQFGQEAREAVERARGKVAQTMGATPEEIIFTSGGTECNNTVLFGVVKKLRHKGNHIIVSAIEHDAILSPCERLEEEGVEVTYLPVDREGFVHPEELRRAITDRTILVSVMHVNNEVGTIQPIQELARVAHERKVLFHTDAVQAIGKIPVDVRQLDVDLLSISSHKLYGPKGVGALFIRRGVTLPPFILGGGHESGMRSGTENVAGIVGFGEAIELAQIEFGTRVAHLNHLAKRLWDQLSTIPNLHLNGPSLGEKRVPGNLHFFVEQLEGENAILYLDEKGFAVSTGSACSSRNNEPSHVLRAMGREYLEAEASLRITLGKDNTEEECDRFVAAFTQMLADFHLAEGSRLKEPSAG